MLDQKTHTVAQFVADYFSAQNKDIDYTEFDCCWNGYVGWVADAGAILEDVIQSSLPAGYQFDEWYSVLEDATAVFKKQLIENRGEPNAANLARAFREIVDRYAYSESSDEPETPAELLVIVDGGVIQGVVSDHPDNFHNVKIRVVDYEVEYTDADADEYVDVIQADRSIKKAIVGDYPVGQATIKIAAEVGRD
jgi:hypothetical protein